MNNNMNTHHTHNRYFYTALFSLMIGIFVILIALILIMRTGYDMSFVPDSFVNTMMPRRNPPVMPVKKGTLTLSDKNMKTSYKTGEVITVVVSADSDGRSISGYDAVLTYDSSKVSFSRVKNLRDDFQTFVKKGTVSPVTLTGVKKLDASRESVFFQTPLAEFSFIVKAGILSTTVTNAPATFNLGFVPGSTQDSNLIDELSEDVLGKIEGVTIPISL